MSDSVLDRYPWLGRCITDYLVSPADRLALMTTSRSLLSHTHAALYETIRLSSLADYTTMADRLRASGYGSMVRTLELRHISCNQAFFTDAADALLTLIPRLTTLELTLSAVPLQRNAIPVTAPYELPDESERTTSLAATFAQSTTYLRTVVATLPGQNEVNSLADDCLPLLLGPLQILLPAIAPHTLILRAGFLPLAPTLLPSSLRTIELHRTSLLSGTLSALIEMLEPGQTLRLVDVRLHLVRPHWHGLSPLDGQPASAWLHLAQRLHYRSAGGATAEGAKVVVRCGCGPAGRRSHLPGGMRGEAAPDVREALVEAFGTRKIGLVIEEEAAVGPELRSKL